MKHEDFMKYHIPVDEVFNKNPNLLEFKIPKSDPNWLEFRKLGFGASEQGTVQGCNDYEILPALMEKKMGLRPMNNSMNEAMLSGIMAEGMILERWMYADGTDLGYVENWMAGRVIRKVDPVSSYIVNTKFPRLFVSLDGKAHPNQVHLTGVKVPYYWPVECKTISVYEAKKWEDGVPASYRYQIQQQMLVTETDYAELATLEDGRRFVVHAFKKDERMQSQILEKSNEAWETMSNLKHIHEEMVYYENQGNSYKSSELRAHYESIMPLPGSEDAFADYYSQKMYADKISFKGNVNDMKLVKTRQTLASAKKIIETEMDMIENHIRRRFVLEQSEYMDFGNNGKVRYFLKEGGKNYQLSFTSTKLSIDKEGIEEKLSFLSK